jgi:tricorn protease
MSLIAGGEYQLATRAADGSGEETILTAFPNGFRYQPVWSPDGGKLAFVDHTMTIHVHDLERKQTVVADQLRWLFHGELLNVRLTWSPDSRWLAYDKAVDHRHNAIHVFDTQSGERHQLTSGGYHDVGPVFDPGGDYLYFLTSRQLDPVYDDLQNTWIYINTMRIAAMPLRRDVASPLKPRNDEEKGREDKEEEGTEEKGKAEEKEKATEKKNENSEKSAGKDKVRPVEIHTTDIERRLVILPPRAGRYADLWSRKGQVLYRRQPNKGAADRESALMFYDLEQREEKTILGDIEAVQLTHDGSKALVRRRREWVLVEPKPDQKFEKPLPTGDLEMTIHPRQEWQQIFSDAWRFNRDYFYDPAHHGLDWAKLRTFYAELLEDAVTRWDVNFVIGELIGELNASHTYRGGGDVEESPSRPVGLLGADLVFEQGGIRIARILRGAAWDSEVRSPLDEPALEVSVGNFIIAVNGVPLVADRSPWFALEGLAGKTVRLTLHDRPALEGSRNVVVKLLTAGEERRLRYLAWVEANRQRVHEATDGRVGYVHVPDTAVPGQTELFRQFRAQIDRPGLIIDERFNSGGQLGDRFLELLGRRPYTYLSSRYGPDMPWPPVGHFGPQVMLINGWSGSGGDAFPWFFRTANRGVILGQRTWGGLIGPAMGHQLIDGGVVVVPPSRLYGPDGKWFAEGHGVDPDIEVEEDPTALARGVDTQLERAIAEIEERLEANPPPAPVRPAYEYRGWPKAE